MLNDKIGNFFSNEETNHRKKEEEGASKYERKKTMKGWNWNRKQIQKLS